MRTVSADVEIVPGVVGPVVVEDSLLSPSSAVEVSFVVRFDKGQRRYLCDELTARRTSSGPGVTTEALRAIPVAHLIRLAVLLPMLKVEGGKAQEARPSRIHDLPNPDGQEPWGRDPPEGLAQEGPTERVLRWVAHIYQFGLAVAYTPTKAVEETFGITRPTAGRWVAAARKRGLLGPAEIGKAG